MNPTAVEIERLYILYFTSLYFTSPHLGYYFVRPDRRVLNSSGPVKAQMTIAMVMTMLMTMMVTMMMCCVISIIVASRRLYKVSRSIQLASPGASPPAAAAAATAAANYSVDPIHGYALIPARGTRLRWRLRDCISFTSLHFTSLHFISDTTSSDPTERC